MFKAIDNQWAEGEFLKFKDEGLPSKEAKTHKFSLWNKRYGQFLGHVKWMAPWRQYTFWPVGGSIYDKKCMREIADFCEEKTTAQREKQK